MSESDVCAGRGDDEALRRSERDFDPGHLRAALVRVRRRPCGALSDRDAARPRHLVPQSPAGLRRSQVLPRAGDRPGRKDGCGTRPGRSVRARDGMVLWSRIRRVVLPGAEAATRTGLPRLGVAYGIIPAVGLSSGEGPRCRSGSPRSGRSTGPGHGRGQASAPRHQLDEVRQLPVGLSVAAALDGVDAARFRAVGDTVELRRRAVEAGHRPGRSRLRRGDEGTRGTPHPDLTHPDGPGPGGAAPASTGTAGHRAHRRHARGTRRSGPPEELGHA